MVTTVAVCVPTTAEFVVYSFITPVVEWIVKSVALRAEFVIAVLTLLMEY